MFAITRKQKAIKQAKAEQKLQAERDAIATRKRENAARAAFRFAKITGRVIGRNSVRKNQPIGDVRAHVLYHHDYTDELVAERYYQGILAGIKLGQEEGLEEQEYRENQERFEATWGLNNTRPRATLR